MILLSIIGSSRRRKDFSKTDSVASRLVGLLDLVSPAVNQVWLSVLLLREETQSEVEETESEGNQFLLETVSCYR